MKKFTRKILEMTVLICLVLISLSCSKNPDREEETSNEPTVKWWPEKAKWKKGFVKVYQLEEGQVLKRIAPPFIQERYEFCKFNGKRMTPESITIYWDDEIKDWDSGGSRDGIPLESILNSTLSMNRYSYEGPDELLEIKVKGDWIVLKYASEEQKLKALEEILTKEIGKNIHFEKRMVERETIVVTGNFKYHKLPEAKDRWDDKWIHMFTDELSPGSRGGGGTAYSVSEFLQAIGNRVVMSVIDRTESSEETKILYRYHYSSYLDRINDPLEKKEKLQLLLDNISRQTDLQFIIEPHTVEIWFVTETREN